MSIVLREFEPIEAALGPACDIWNVAVAPQSDLYLPMTPALMAERLAGRTGVPADICLLAEMEGESVGLAVATATPLSEAHVANLACVAVRPERQGQGIGTRLLEEVERRCRAAGRQVLRVDYATTARLAHGVDPATPGHLWLLHRGFRVYRDQLFMRLDLAQWRMPDAIKRLTEGLRRAGVALRMAEAGDLAALENLTAEFGLTLTVAPPVLIAVEGERVLGFVGPLTVSPCGFPDFDLIAVTAAERGRGIGKALFYGCLEYFQQHEGKLFELMTSPTNPAQKLYLDAGMEMITTLMCHEKML